MLTLVQLSDRRRWKRMRGTSPDESRTSRTSSARRSHFRRAGSCAIDLLGNPEDAYILPMLLAIDIRSAAAVSSLPTSCEGMVGAGVSLRGGAAAGRAEPALRTLDTLVQRARVVAHELCARWAEVLQHIASGECVCAA